MPGGDRLLKRLDHKEDVLKVYEMLKKNQYGQYLKDVLDGKYLDALTKPTDFRTAFTADSFDGIRIRSIIKRRYFMNIIVTGGAGFIGSNFIFHMLKNTRIIVSYAWTA